MPEMTGRHNVTNLSRRDNSPVHAGKMDKSHDRGVSTDNTAISRITVPLDSGVTLRIVRQVPKAINICSGLTGHAVSRGGYPLKGVLPDAWLAGGEQAWPL
jgi:hypothetical protein